jgi:hypothetical protein
MCRKVFKKNMARVKHGYNGRYGNDNRIDDTESWQELNQIAEQNGQEVQVNHLCVTVSGTGILSPVSNAGVKELLQKVREQQL